MNNKIRHFKKRVAALVLAMASQLASNVQAETPDPDLGSRADWLKGAWGGLWLPEKTYNGNIEGVTIDEYIAQLKDVRTLDYIQLPLTSPNIYSPTHTGPHDIIESLWQGDTDDNGDPINLVVPRASKDDPLLSWLLALRAEGFRSEIYVNSYNLLARIPDSIPEGYPDVSERWMNWCDTNEDAQSFLNSQSYYGNDSDTRRKYMFCYAEFILKEYAVRYGDLIDAWVFDSADNIMEDEAGDDPSSEDIDDQRVYEAFANAARAGNPNAAVAFNNSVGTDEVPLTTPTLFDDYTFGHPFGGAGNMVVPDILYTRNFAIPELMGSTNGLPFKTDDRDWNDNVIGHFFPKQSATSWNGGKTACLTDEQFVEWTATGVINGGAITWGTPLVTNNLENKAPNLILWDYALTQITLADEYLQEFQSPIKPNWARQYTILPDAVAGEPYSHTLTTGVDFWDPEGDAITQLYAVEVDTSPDWLTITETSEGVWTLSGTPTESASVDYSFRLRVKGADGGTNRNVELSVTGSGICPSPDIVEGAVPVKVFGSKTKGTNLAQNSTDGDLATRWAAKGEGEYLQFKFAEPTAIEAMNVAFYKGDSRAVSFHIESTNTPWSLTPNWQTHLASVSDKTTDGLQAYKLSEPVTATFFRIIGFGFEGNWGWSGDLLGINEVEFIGAGTSNVEPVITAVFDDGSSHIDYPVSNVLDNDTSHSSRWASSGSPASLTLQLEAISNVTEVGVAWGGGDSRSFKFDIFGRITKNGPWVKVYEGNSSGETTDIESYTFPASFAQQLQIRILENSAGSEWTDITEVTVNGMGLSLDNCI